MSVPNCIMVSFKLLISNSVAKEDAIDLPVCGAIIASSLDL